MTSHRALAVLLVVLAFAAPASLATHMEEDALGNPAFHEDYEDILTFSTPERPDLYTTTTTGTGGGSALVRSDPPVAMEGANALRVHKSSTSSSTFAMQANFPGQDLCLAGTGITEFDFVLDSMQNAVAQNLQFGWHADQTASIDSSPRIAFNVNSATLQVSATVTSNSDTTSGVLLTAITLDTLYHFRIQGVNCGNGAATFVETTTGNGLTLDLTGTGHVFTALDTWQVRTQAATTQTWVAWMDDWVIPIALAPEGALGAADSVAVTDLSGFDVDLGGHWAIARHDGTSFGSAVTTYTAQGLDVAGGPVETSCSQFDAVTAASENVGYLSCGVGPGGLDVLKIKSGTLGLPNTPDDCEDFDPADIDEWILDDDLQTEVVESYDLFSVDFEVNPNLGSEQCFIVPVYVAISTLDGRIGYTELIASTSDIVQDQITRTVQYSTSPVAQVCGVEQIYAPGTGLYIVAVDGGQSTTVKKINPDEDRIDAVSSIGGPLSSAKGVGCGSNQHVFILTASTIYKYDFLEGSTQTAVTGIVASHARGVTVSWDNQWFAYVDGSTAYVANATSFEVTASMPLPAGTFQEIRMDATAQNVWIATDDNVARYEVLEFTTGEPESPDVRDDIIDAIEDVDDSENQGDLFPEPTAEQVAIFGSAAAVEGIRGLSMLTSGGAVGGSATAAYAINTKQKIPVKVIVAVVAACSVIGTVVGWLFGIVEDWFLGITVAVLIFTVVGVVVAKFVGSD